MRFRLRLHRLVATAVLAGCAAGEGDPCTSGECGGGVSQVCDSFDPLRQAFFGDTHVHTALSYDANIRGTRVGPQGAYRFARGESIDIPPYDDDGNALRSIRRDRPLDWVAISDHAEHLGVVYQCTHPEEPGYSDPACETYRASPDAVSFIGLETVALPSGAGYPSLCGDGGKFCLDSGLDVWASYVEDTNAANDPTTACEFTTFPAYEWSGAPGLRNMHRNVIFRTADVPPRAVSYFDAPYVEELWAQLRDQCTNADIGCDVITIPHNSNLSSGLMFERWNREGDAIDAEYARARAAMEPLVEIFQHKGGSECLPGQATSDEFCGFEKIPGDRLGYAGSFSDPVPSSFVRVALGEGLKAQAVLSENPFKYGFVASTDTHIAAPGHTTEVGYAGHGDISAGATASEFAEALVDNPFNSPGGLAVVWAEENSRDAIFRALRRKETFGTSGTHIVVRFFGGWEYGGDMCDDPTFAEVGYELGVPMGGDLPASAPGQDAPRFFVLASQDPGSAEEPGTLLQRIQVVKGWLDATGEFQARTFDVAGNPDNGATVDPVSCEPNAGEGGFATLCSVWTDPEFDPEVQAFYYARVLENPTCRWTTRGCRSEGIDCEDPSTITSPDFALCCDLTDEQCAAAAVDCAALPVPEEFASCCRPRVPRTIQERAWTSPIWYTP